MEWTGFMFAGLAVVLTAGILIRKKEPKKAVLVDSEGEKVYRAAYWPDELVKVAPTDVKTMHESFIQSVKNNGDLRCTGTRKKGKGKDEWGEYEWKTYKQLKQRSDNFASGLVRLGAKKGDRIGIFSKNREEWLVTQQACFSQSLVIVSFYETLGRDSIRFVADHSEISIAVCNPESLSKMFEVIEGNKGCKAIKHLIVMGTVDDDSKKRSDQLGVALLAFEDVEKDGQTNPVKENPPNSSDMCTIMYTSGTTGTPKGVVLTHQNLVSELAAILKAYDVTNKVMYLSYLPLAHIFERVILLACLHQGAHVGFYHGDVQAVVDDAKTLKPTAFIGVPRVYDRAKQAILKEVSKKSFIEQLVFRLAFAIKKFHVLHAPWLPVGFLDKLVFNKTKQALGGKVDVMVSAGAPLSLESEIFLRTCFGIPVSQAYGLTETCGASCFKLASDPTVGHLGGPMSCNELKLEDLKDMGYTTNDKPNPRGELLIRGPNVCAGYYKDEEKTKESFKNGWFYTGDIAEVTSSGGFRIVDRKKNMFKLAQGEYVAVEKVEDKLTHHCDLIEQIFVYGDSQQNSLVAIVVPKKGALPSGAKSGDINNKEARELVKKKIMEAGRAADLQGFEIPRNVWLTADQFTVENDLMTPTMKLKRNTLQAKFKEEIAKMYKEGGEGGN